MKKIAFQILFFLFAIDSFGAQQTAIPRIEQMSNLPTPYQMRDWKKVALDYDHFIFDTSSTGTYLPITKISTSGGVNYSDVKTIRMDTYVGQSDHGYVAEAINIMPAVIGASLVGIDKTAPLNVNWVVKVKDFFNLKNGQNVYLNNYSNTTGSDWWYEVMPNVYFYQLYALYPEADADFKTQFVTIADRELEVLHKLGGTVQPWKAPSMNYRAFNLMTGLPNKTSVPEPEAAGSIAWLQYQAYNQTGNLKYLQGAELALDFLQNWTSNPSYEIQLPYGIATAARMNATEGTNYDIGKFLNWTFCAGQGTLRSWGCIVGNWNGYDVSGLIGEANDAGDDYAFSMNGFQHAAALAPVAKYDKRYARAIGKWILNLANASRLFYRNGLPQSNQEPASYAWANQYDTAACIPYESMKQNWNGTKPYAMGDAVRGGWAATNLSMYSGSSVGYMAGILEKTNVEGILQIDLNKTDFRGENTYPVYLYYNPLATMQTVELVLPTDGCDVYDAIGETVLKTNVSDTVRFTIDPDAVRLLVIYPTGKTAVVKGRLKTVNGAVLDFHTNYDFTNALRIKAFSVSDTLVQIRDSISVYCLTENNTTTDTVYEWFQNGEKIATTTTGTWKWKVPETVGVYRLICVVSEKGDTARSESIPITVAEKVYKVPAIESIRFSGSMPLEVDSSFLVSASLNTEEVQYAWSCDGGTLDNAGTASPTWFSPASPGIYMITLVATNEAGTSTLSKPVLVKDFSVTEEPVPLIYYPLNGDVRNYAQDAFHGVSVNAVPTTGANGVTDGAYQFPSSAAYLYTPNEAALNFQDKIAVSFWVKPDALPSNEQFILSHGSWEERYKVSITPEKKVRWTVKTNSSVVDVDADSILETGKFDYFTAMYTGYSLELYRNGLLSGFKPLTGNIQTTDNSLTIARKDEATSDYSFKGTVDEVRVYDTELPQNIIHALPKAFTLNVIPKDTALSSFTVYPNPFSEEITISLPSGEIMEKAEVYDLLGRCRYRARGSATSLRISGPDGFFFLKIYTESRAVFTTKIIRQN
ncbi:MAG: T9SS type A sorting domain-containing protein [Bacteroidales bacterium]|nr:T9SS type A sorting domain-containing protein [Bacteroidales bacterium]